MFENIKEEAAAYVDEVWEDVVADIAKLVSIRSVEDLGAAAPGAPWGPASHEALVAGLDLCSRLGLDAHDCEGYIGYADLPGKSEKQIATIAHTDVVPEGVGWTFKPYEMARHEGYLVGRGVLDDKGPFVLSAYAAHFFARLVKRTGEELPYTLRCIVGNDEETTMADVDWYLEHYAQPDFLFTPDAMFPLICGEKGLFGGLYTTRDSVLEPDGLIVEIDAGTAANAIPGLATAVVRANQTPDAWQPAEGVDIEDAGEGLLKVVAHGVGGHAAFPEGTVNAVGVLVRYLKAQGVYGDESADGVGRFLRLVEVLTTTSDGSAVGIDTSDEVFGALTMNSGVVRTVDGKLTVSVDSRFPTSTTAEALIARFAELGEGLGCAFAAGHVAEPFYMDPSMPQIQTLLATYREYTGSDAEPVVIGGGTYARHFARACAFGPDDPTVKNPDWVGAEHGPDEAVSEEALKRALNIYIVSIARLMQLDL